MEHDEQLARELQAKETVEALQPIPDLEAAELQAVDIAKVASLA